MKEQKQDLVIVGAGIMGLMTAYYASQRGYRVTILEKRTIGNKEAASFSFTRSIRNDYLDPYYSLLASESQNLWKELQKFSSEEFFIRCGCLNIAKKSVTPKLGETYAQKAYQNLDNLQFKTKILSQKEIKKSFPQFNVDLATLDVNAGLLYLPIITKLLIKLLKKNGVFIQENVDVIEIIETKDFVTVKTNQGIVTSKKIIITAGIWTNEVLKIIKNNVIYLPISPDKPSQCKYFLLNNMKNFTTKELPVFAYLDVGIYGHPYYIGKTKGVKIGYFNPVNVETVKKSKITNIDDFINECMPMLKNAKVVDVTDADQCSYQMTPDGDFIVGKLPKSSNIFVISACNGTGYKFAPLIGKSIAQLALQNATVYNIKRFSPERFIK